ncbi:unnamed protein product [marine sediment metagenome]|uniref:TonB-dependent receptor-like beta-barrel domain-containing protein n=1 Tax=marine sediment metagenome TaxID=412755 RepID=X1MIM8_9ZZZZ
MENNVTIVMGGGYDNPYWTANKNSYDDRTNRFTGNGIFQYRFADWLNLSYNGGIDWYNRRTKNILAVYSRGQPSGFVSEYSYFGTILNSDLLLNFSHNVGDDLEFKLTVGNNLYASYGKSVYGDATSLSIIEFYQLSNTSNRN